MALREAIILEIAVDEFNTYLAVVLESHLVLLLKWVCEVMYNALLCKTYVDISTIMSDLSRMTGFEQGSV